MHNLEITAIRFGTRIFGLPRHSTSEKLMKVLQLMFTKKLNVVGNPGAEIRVRG